MPLSANFRREMLAALKTAKKNKEKQNLPDEDEGNKSSENSSPVIKDTQEPDKSNVVIKGK